MADEAEPLSSAALRELLSSPPTDFVAARNALVKELRAARHREVAGAVAALRRPGWVDWALNSTSQTEPEAMDAFAEAAAASRAAQDDAVAGKKGVDLRAALRELRQAISTLASGAGAVLRDAGRTAVTADVVTRLGELATDESAVDALRAGVLGAEELDDDALVTMPDGPARRRKNPAAGSRAAKRSPSSKDKPVSLDDARQRRDRERRVERAERELGSAAAALQRAVDEETDAEEEATRAEQALAEARTRLTTARRQRAAAVKAAAKSEKAAAAVRRAIEADT